ncbi:MAG: TonB-dependent receptor [Gemmatimonadaceae bacterium]
MTSYWQRAVVACGVLVLSRTPLAAQAAAPSATTTGTISGRVVSAATREPLIGVALAVPPTTSPATSGVSTLSDSLGRFTLRAVPVGVVRLELRRVGYRPEVRTDIVVSAARTTELVLELTPVATTLAAVAVRPGYFPVLPAPALPVSTQRFSAEEVRRAPGVQEDVVRAVSVLPGVGVTEAGRNDLVVRGGAPFENLFTVDGIEVPNINHFGTQGSTGGPLSLINLAFVADAALSAGGFGVRYGDRTSSVTAIRLRDGARDRFTAEANLSATGGGLIAEGPLGRTGSVMVGVRRSYLDLLFKAAGFGFIPAYTDLTAKAVVRPTARDQLSALLIGADGTVTFNNSTEEQRFENSRVAAPQQQQYFSGLIWQRTLARGLFTATLGRTWTRYRTTQNDSGSTTAAPAVLFRANSAEGDNSLRTEWQWRSSPQVEWELGHVLRYASQLAYDVMLPGAYRRDAAFTPRPLRADTNFHAMRGGSYLQVTRQLTGALRMTAGVRGDWYGHLQDAVRVAPRVSATWQLNPVTSASFSAGRYWQAPPFIWLVGDATNAGQLRPFAADQVVAGFTREVREDTKVQVEVFAKQYRGYPARAFRPQAVLQPTGFDDVTNDIPFGLEPLAGVGTGHVIGAELLVQKKLSIIPVYGLLTISANRTAFTGLDGVSRRGAFDVPVVANLLLGWRPNARWEASGRVRGSSGRPITPFITDGSMQGTLDFARYNAGGRLPTFASLDLRVDRRWQFRRGQLITYLDVQNATGRNNVSQITWNPRLRQTERQESLGVLPSIGVNWSF